MKISLPLHRFTTKNVGAINTFFVNRAKQQNGIILGRNLHGGVFCFDPFKLYASGLITSPNVVIFGQIGRGKSTIIKTFALRQPPNTYNTLIIDPKGEYSKVAQAKNGFIVRLEPNGKQMINPLSRLALWRTYEGELETSSLLSALTETAIQRPLKPVEKAILDSTVTYMIQSDSQTEPNLECFINYLFEPSANQLRELRISKTQFLEISREMIYELRRLITGDLKGMFNKSTIKPNQLKKPLIVIDLSKVYNNNSLALVMACVKHWLESVSLTNNNMKKTFLVYDEAWALLNNESILNWLRGSYKLARARGISNIAVVHRVSDLLEAKNNSPIGILKDSEVKVLLRQDPSEISLLKDFIGLSDSEAEVLPRLPKGVALIKLPDSTFLVEVCLTDEETLICDSDKAML